jgi:hypothetical protein
MAVVSVHRAAVWLAGLAVISPAQMEEYTSAIRSFKTSGDAGVADQLEHLINRRPQFIQAYRALNAVSRRSGTPERSQRHFAALLSSPETKAYGHLGLAAYYVSRRQ